jgi:t-SNARE complex subunit (syntaxin)
MREYFEKIGEIKASIKAGRANVDQMGAALEELLLATTRERENAASARLRALVDETTALIGSAKSSLALVSEGSAEEETKRPGSAEVRIRANTERMMIKKHQQLLSDFQKAQALFKQALERRQAQEMQILMPDASAETRAEMIERGETASMIMAQRISTHALLLDEVHRIQEKHQDIRRLEASITDLGQMFQEMSVLVDAQGEMLDFIEVHVQKTKGYTTKGVDALVTSRKTQFKNRKWMCCITIFMLLLLLCILGPVIVAEA